MKLFTDLVTTDYGLLSFATIGFVLVMAGWFGLYFKRKIAEDAKAAGL